MASVPPFECWETYKEKNGEINCHSQTPILLVMKVRDSDMNVGTLDLGPKLVLFSLLCFIGIGNRSSLALGYSVVFLCHCSVFSCLLFLCVCLLLKIVKA